MCIEEQMPFEIPDSWQWIRLATVGDWGSGATPSRTHPEYYGGDIPWLKTGDLNDDYIVHIPESITKEALEKTSVRLNPKDSVLIAMYGATIGKLGILTYPATTNQACCACLPIEGVYNKFLFYFLMSHKTAFIKRGEGGAQPNISKEKIIATLMPLPPITEQQRIVAKIEQILPHIKEYELAESRIGQLNAAFPEQLKKSILQDAVQGKLVPQDPSDEPASILLERIREEKVRLVKEGKIKKDKNESVIFRRDNSYYEKVGDNEAILISDKLPFEIPNSWEWVRVSSIGYMVRGKGIKRSEIVDKGFPCIRYGEIYTSYNISFTAALSHVEESIYNSCNHISKGDVVMTLTGENKTDIAKSIVYLGDNEIAAGGDLAYWTQHQMNPLYLMYFMASPYCIEQKRRSATGDIIVHISIEKIGNFFMPVPPLTEQNRIVDKIEQLIGMTKGL